MTKLVRVVAVFIMAAMATAACGERAADHAAPKPVNATQATSGQDAHPAHDAAFFSPLRPGEGAVLTRQPASLDAAYKEATATVLAEVVDVRAGRTIKELQFAVVELRTIEILRGALRPELNGQVRVEFPLAFLPDPVQPIVDRMRASLPTSRSVWLLQWQGAPRETKPGAPRSATIDPTLYNVVHPNSGVFAQGDKAVVAVTAQAGHDDGPARYAQAEGERFARLSDLVAHARGKR
jgi:hypothetical protein